MHALGASVQRALCDNNAKTDDQLGDGSLMRAEPQEKLNPRIKAVWRISDALMLTAAWLILASPGAIALLSMRRRRIGQNPTCWHVPFCTRFC